MKPTSELFELIKSLTRNEKRYFKINTSKQKGTKNYIKLFDAIESLDIYDEALIRKKYRNENFVRNLTYNKNYLRKLIFKSLVSYAEEKTVDARLYNMLGRCKFLFAKSLFGQYFKTVQYGKEMSVKYERFTYLLEFLELERQLSKKEDLNKLNLQNVYDAEIEILDKLRNINEYKRAVSSLFRIYWNNGVVRDKTLDEKIDEIISEEKFSLKKAPMPLIAKERYYFALYLAYEIKYDMDKSFMYNSKRLELIQSNEKIFQKFIFDNPEETFVTLIISAVNAGEFQTAKNLFEKYKRKFRVKGNSIDTLTVSFMIQLKEAIATDGRVDQKLVSGIEDMLIAYKGKLNIDSYNQFYFDLSVLFLFKGEHEQALSYINALFQSKYLKHTPSLEPYARMLNIIIHFEIGNYKLLNHLIAAAIKYMKSKNGYYKTEEAILKYLNDQTKRKDSDIEMVKMLKKKIEQIQTNKYEKNSIRYFDYMKWIDNKIKQNKK